MVNIAKSSGNLSWYTKWYAIKHCQGVYNSCFFFDYSDRSFALLTGRSIHTARNWKNKFIELGWCEINKEGHLKFIPENQIVEEQTGFPRKKRVHKIEVQYSKSSMAWEDLYDKLCLELLIRKKQSIEFFKKKTKQGLKLARAECRLVDEKRSLALSYESIGKLFGVSKTSAFNIIKRLEIKGLISKINVKAKISDEKMLHSSENERVFSTMKGTFIQMNNRYFFEGRSFRWYAIADKKATRNFKKNTVVIDDCTKEYSLCFF